jgi:hypothetical protein
VSRVLAINILPASERATDTEDPVGLVGPYNRVVENKHSTVIGS